MKSNTANINQLKEQFEQLFQQIIEIKILSEDLIYLHPKHDNYNELIFHLPLLNRLVEGLRTQFALRFVTFLNNKEHYNLTSFVNFIIKQFEEIEFQNSIRIEEIEKCRNSISKIKKSNEHKALLHIRNKHLAHIDKDRSDTNLPEVYQEDIDLLINQLIDIFKFIGSKLFGTSYIVKLMNWDKDHNLLDLLSAFYDLSELYEYKKYKMNKEPISIDEYEEILNKANR